MNNREIFEVVEVEIVAFDTEDIIRTSSEPSEDDIIAGDPINMFGEFVRPQA